MAYPWKYIDIHTHINLDAFHDDWMAVETNTLAEGVAHINVGTGVETSKRAVELADIFDGVYATVGLHPIHTGKEDKIFDLKQYKIFAKHPRVVAIGECGLDYYRVQENAKMQQEEVFISQILLANDFNKPLMLHVRDVVGSVSAYTDTLLILKAYAKVLGNVHFFAGTYEIAKQFWEIGFTTSFTGVITFTQQYDEVIKNAPIEMLHAETDSPYVAPIPFRGQRNEPLHVREVYKRIAGIRDEDEEYIRSTLLKNAKRMFNINI